MSQSASSPLDSAASAKPESVGRPRIMVIEDSAPLRRMLVKILERIGAVCVEAGDGKEALELLRQQGPQSLALILADLMMPVMDGATFITMAKKEFDLSLPPILICSSRSDREAIQTVMRLGVTGYILKPFKANTVIDKMREMLPELAEGKTPTTPAPPASPSE